MSVWSRLTQPIKILPDNFTIMGETKEGWEEIGGEWFGTAFLWALRWLYYLACVYGLVKFVKWAWSSPFLNPTP